MDRSRGLRHVRPHLHRAEGRGPEGGDHRDVERVTPASDQDPTNTASVVAGVERPPATAEPHLHPRGKVHRVWVGWDVQVGQVAEHIARRDVEGTAERDGKVRQVAAHALAIPQYVHRGGQRIAGPVLELDVVMDPVATGLDPGAAWFRLAEQLPG